MAAPSFVAASTGTFDVTGPWSHTGHVPSAVGNVYIFQLLNDGNTGAAAPTGATNIEDLAGTDNQWLDMSSGGFQVGSPSAAIGYLYIGRTINASAPTVSGDNASGEDLYMRMYEFTNVSTATTLAGVIENGTVGSFLTLSSTSATINAQQVTSLGPDRLALQFVWVNDDNALDNFTGETGGDWTEPVAEYAEATGTDGAIGLQTAALASAGLISGGSDTMLASDSWGCGATALIGTTVTELTPRYPAINFQDPAVLMGGLRRAWHRRRCGIFVPEYGI